MNDKSLRQIIKDYTAGVRLDAVETVAEWLKPGVMQLRAGEMTAQELRTATAVVTAIVAELRALSELKP